MHTQQQDRPRHSALSSAPRIVCLTVTIGAVAALSLSGLPRALDPVCWSSHEHQRCLMTGRA
jgi:hypothetical protein